jgi:hypothetical protein
MKQSFVLFSFDHFAGGKRPTSDAMLSEDYSEASGGTTLLEVDAGRLIMQNHVE